jgi:hypothetical protein
VKPAADNACHCAGLTCFLPLFIERFICETFPVFAGFYFARNFGSILSPNDYFSAPAERFRSCTSRNLPFAQETEAKNIKSKNNTPIPLKLSIIKFSPMLDEYFVNPVGAPTAKHSKL